MMTTVYFLTGSYNDKDNDFELKVTVTKNPATGSPDSYRAVLKNLADPGRQLWETLQPTFIECLNDMDDFLSDNFIVLYSKILTSVERDSMIDKELEGFILNHLEN